MKAAAAARLHRENAAKAHDWKERERLRQNAAQKYREEKDQLRNEREILRLEKYSTKPAIMYRYRTILTPFAQVCCWLLLFYYLVLFPEKDAVFAEAGLVILSLSLTIFIAYVSVVSGDSRWDYSAMAECGDAPERAIIFVSSPIISMILCLIAILVMGIQVLIWVSLGVIFLTVGVFLLLGLRASA